MKWSQRQNHWRWIGLSALFPPPPPTQPNHHPQPQPQPPTPTTPPHPLLHFPPWGILVFTVMTAKPCRTNGIGNIIERGQIMFKKYTCYEGLFHKLRIVESSYSILTLKKCWLLTILSSKMPYLRKVYGLSGLGAHGSFVQWLYWWWSQVVMSIWSWWCVLLKATNAIKQHIRQIGPMIKSAGSMSG